MDFKKLGDEDLHFRLLDSVKEEKKVVTCVLHLLKEVDSRKLYCDYKCRSLFDYATKYLKYSEAEAYTRINAMKLIREIPEIETDISSGDLSLSVVAQAQSFFRKQKQFAINSISGEPQDQTAKSMTKEVSLLTDEACSQSNESSRELPSSHKIKTTEMNKREKKELLAHLKNQSTRQAKVTLAKLLPDHKKQDSIKTLPDGKIEIRFTVNSDTFKKIQELKNLHEKTHKGICFEELFHRLHEQRVSYIKTRAPRKHGVSNKTLTPAMKMTIKKRDSFCCKNCGSNKDLEIDHIKPQSLGGRHHPCNLQTLCRPCNQRRAIKSFGVDKVSRF